MIRKQPSPQPEHLYLNLIAHPYSVYSLDGRFIATFSNLECAARSAVWQKGWGLTCEVRIDYGSNLNQKYDLTSCKQIAANAHLEAIRRERERSMKEWQAS